MQNDIESVLRNAKKVSVPDSTFIKVDDVLQNLKHRKEEKRMRPIYRKFAAFAAAALVVCLMVLGGTLLSPQNSNTFELKAYAMEQQDDGSVELREVDLLDQTNGWSFNDDGENVYINVWLKCEGENLDSVDFYTGEGFFAKQYIERKNGKIVWEKTGGIGRPDGTITITSFGRDYEYIGSKLTLSANEMTDDLLLFWGRESRRVGHDLNLPSELTLRAVATFTDGKTQEETVAIDLSVLSELVGSFKLTDEEIEQSRAESIRREDLVHSIPLELCEVVPGSEIILNYGDTYEYIINVSPDGTVTGKGMHPVTEDSMDFAKYGGERDGIKGPFDANGVMRFGSGLYSSSTWEEYDGSDGYISAIESNGDGTFTGKTYKVPGELIIEHLK